MGNNNDEMTIAEKMRRAVSWLDFLDENFNDHFKSADGVLKVWEKHEYEEIDNLWEYLEPDEDGWIDEVKKDQNKRQRKPAGQPPATISHYYGFIQTDISDTRQKHHWQRPEV